MRYSKKFVTALLMLIMVAVFLFPVLDAGQGQQPPVEKATIGTFWWYRDNGGLIYAQDDAEGFAQTLEDDGCSWDLNINDVTGSEDLIDDHLEDGAGELIDDVELAYFVGHSNEENLGIGAGIGTNLYAEWDECQWGDDSEGVKWVVLATCLAANGKFSYALEGAHLILGWETASSDSLFGPTFANYIKQGMTLKEAWFLTGEECEPVHSVAKILGEDETVGDDHLKGYGSYAPSPTVDEDYTWWTQEVYGWTANYVWMPPDNHEDGDWHLENLAYNQEYPDYAAGYKPYAPFWDQTYAFFNEGQDGWSDPLVLTLDNPVTIQGFRTIAGEGDHIDQMKVKFYLGDDPDPQTTVIIDEWEEAFWRIIDFDAPYKADVDGVFEPEVDRVEIQFHEDSIFGFGVNPAKVGEFDFWIAGVENQGGSGVNGSGDDTKDDPGEGVGIFEVSAISQSMGMEIGMRSIGATTSKSSSNNNAYTSIPDEYNPDMFASLTNKLDITKDNEKTLQYNEQKGVWKYVSPSEAYPTVNKKPILPSDGESVALAVAFMEENGFSTEDITDVIVTYQKQGAGVKGTEEVLYEWVITKNVNFKKEINGVSINEKNTITIGEGGTISAFTIPTNTIELI